MSSARELSRNTGVCVLISPDECDLSTIAEDAGFQVLLLRNRRDALDALSRREIHVVIVNDDPEDTIWREVLEDLRNLPCPPPLVVTSRLADEHLWSEVLNRGGFDVLVQPFDSEEVRRVIASAWRHYFPPAKPVAKRSRRAATA